MVKENKKDSLLSILYCCHMPKLLQGMATIRSVFTDQPLDQKLFS